MKTDENQIQKENAKLILDHTYRIVISYMKKGLDGKPSHYQLLLI